jgi:hypothetical protein
MFSHKGPFKMHTVSCSKKKAESERKKEHAEIAIEKVISFLTLHSMPMACIVLLLISQIC